MTPVQDALLAETLRAVAIFSHLPKESDACFAALRRGAIRDFGSGDLVLARNDADHAIFLVDGMVQSGEHGPTFSTPGDYFGVFELIAHRTVDEDLIAIGRVRAFELERSALNDLLDSCPSMVARLLADCARQLLNNEMRRD